MYNYTYYTKWFEQLAQIEQKFDQLFNLFRQLLLQTNGDVNEALNWMTNLNNRYHFTDGLDDFIDKLKEEGLISDQDDVFILTGKGNQTIRKTAFNEIFSNLCKKEVWVSIRSHEPEKGLNNCRRHDRIVLAIHWKILRQPEV